MLSRQPKVTINPIYVLNPKRKSFHNELHAIQKIIDLLKQKPDTKAEITPVQIINLSDIEIDSEIREARQLLSKQIGGLGYQYDYLSSLAKAHGQIGLGLEKAPDTGSDVGAVATIRKNGGLIKKAGFYYLNTQKATPEAKLVFQNMFFPVIDTTEVQMRKNFESWGYHDIMQNTWFCHSPINGQPCGLCRPCEEKMSSDMESLLPPKAQTRYFKAQKLHIFGKSLSRRIKNLTIWLLSHFAKH